MSFSSLLSGYAKSKSVPVVEMKKEPIAPKPHPLKEVLTNIRSRTTPVPGFLDSDQSIQRNLGILVTIIDDFPNELLWRLWLDNANAYNTFEESLSVRMWFHAKCPEKVRSPWVRERIIRSARFKPEWGSIEITKAMAHMLHEALFDAPHINKFCFASESCIPIRSLSETLDIIYSSNATTAGGVNNDVNISWLNYSHIPNNGYAKQLQHDPLSRALPDGCVYKASQWVMLSRAHAVAVIDLMQQVGQRVPSHSNTNATIRSGNNSSESSGIDPSAELPALSNALFSAFQLVGKASDEMFFPSCLAVVGAIEPFDVEGKDSNTRSTTLDATTNSTGSVNKQQITYCDWTDNAKSPHEYASFPTALVTALTQYKHYSTTATNKKTLETLHIQPEQQYACFLRKIKFPMDKAEVKAGDFSEAQLTFLSDWLPFIVEKVVTSSACDVAPAASTAISSDSTTTDITVNAPTPVSASTTNDSSSASIMYMQHAQDLYSQITSYPIPERVIKKRPLIEEHSANYSRHGNNHRDDRYSEDYNNERYNRDGGYNSGHSDRLGQSNDRSYGYNNEYGNGYNNQSSGRDRQDNDSYDRYYSSNDRRKDYRDNYANKSSRYY